MRWRRWRTCKLWSSSTPLPRGRGGGGGTYESRGNRAEETRAHMSLYLGGRMLMVDFGKPSYEFTVNICTYLIFQLMVLTPPGIKFTLACPFWSLLFTQEINVKEETFRISSSSTSREHHEARHKSRHIMNMTPNGSGTEA
jgi:hypothetical protein